MTYEEALNIKSGDYVFLINNPNRMEVVNTTVEDQKAVHILCRTPPPHAFTTCTHQIVERVIPNNMLYSAYYQIVAFNQPEDTDDICQSHIYPSYVSCMLKTGFYKPFGAEDTKDKPLMLQSNFADGLAFTNTRFIPEILNKAKSTWPNKEFHVIKMDAFVFGKRLPRWVVNA